MTAFYNEIDPYAAQWLRNLITSGHIAPGVVDERSILDISPEELNGFTQCHFFAGIGVWSLALRLAGWPDGRPVWTGSCPCQPFSAAGKAAGFDDERHLWPAWFHHIDQCRPPVIFGEQVASPDGLNWLDLVSADLEGAGYAIGAVDLGAAGLGAPHIRQRLWFVADAQCGAAERQRQHLGGAQEGGPGQAREQRLRLDAGHGLLPGDLGDPDHARCKGDGLQQVLAGRTGDEQDPCPSGSGSVDHLADAEGDRHCPGTLGCEDGEEPADSGRGVAEGMRKPQCGDRLRVDCDPLRGPWAGADWIYCRDEKARAVEPGTFPLADGSPSRVGRLRAYGNSIVPQVAEAVIRAYLGQ